MTRVPNSAWLAVSLSVAALSASDAQRTTRSRVVPVPFDSVVHENADREDLNTHFVGRLDLPLMEYANRGPEFWKLLNGKPWHGHVRKRECLECRPGETSLMKIEAMSNVNRDPLTRLPDNGVVVGRVINLGEHVDSAARVAPHRGRRPPAELYFVIRDRHDPMSADLYVAVVTFDERGAVNQHLDIEPSPLLYRKCPGHTEPVRRVSEGDFRNCPGEDRKTQWMPSNRRHAGRPPNPVRPAVLAGVSAGVSLPFLDALAWFSCDAGCCTAQFPPRSDGTIMGAAAAAGGSGPGIVAGVPSPVILSGGAR